MNIYKITDILKLKAFDVPVVHIELEGQGKPIKLMHRIEVAQVLSVVEEQSSATK